MGLGGLGGGLFFNAGQEEPVLRAGPGLEGEVRPQEEAPVPVPRKKLIGLDTLDQKITDLEAKGLGRSIAQKLRNALKASTKLETADVLVKFLKQRRDELEGVSFPPGKFQGAVIRKIFDDLTRDAEQFASRVKSGPEFMEREREVLERQKRIQEEALRKQEKVPLPTETEEEKALREVGGVKTEAQRELARRIREREEFEERKKPGIDILEKEFPTVTDPSPDDRDKPPPTDDGKQQLTAAQKQMQDLMEGIRGIQQAGGSTEDLRLFLRSWVRGSGRPDEDEGGFQQRFKEAMKWIGNPDEQATNADAIAVIRQRIENIQNRGWLQNFLRVLAVVLGGQSSAAALQMIDNEQSQLLQLNLKQIELLQAPQQREERRRELVFRTLAPLIQREAEGRRGPRGFSRQKEERAILQDIREEMRPLLTDVFITADLAENGLASGTVTQSLVRLRPLFKQLLSITTGKKIEEITDKEAENAAINFSIQPAIQAAQAR